jgi:large subunit ribosomal protein L15
MLGQKRIKNALDAASRQGRVKLPAAVPRAQGARSGEGGHAYRQGGNLPFFRRLPFMRGEGFTPPNQVFYNEVNLDQLSQAFKANAEVTPEALEEAHLLRDSRNPTVVLGRGEMTVALKSRVHRVSAGAKAKIEKAGGSVELIA